MGCICKRLTRTQPTLTQINVALLLALPAPSRLQPTLVNILPSQYSDFGCQSRNSSPAIFVFLAN